MASKHARVSRFPMRSSARCTAASKPRDLVHSHSACQAATSTGLLSEFAARSQTGPRYSRDQVVMPISRQAPINELVYSLQSAVLECRFELRPQQVHRGMHLLSLQEFNKDAHTTRL